MRNFSLKVFALDIVGFSVIFNSYSQTPKPNIVFILADDFGYGSVNCYGADKNLVRTPHIDGLAEAGMRFTHAHTPSSVSSPTRYGFLTGQYPWRSSMKHGVVDPDGPLLPSPDRVTVADILKDQGYNTAAIGKWHLGYGDKQPCDFTGKLTPGPLDLGFDYHFAVPQNHGDYWGVYVENDEIYGLKSKKAHPYSKTFYGEPYKGFDAPQRENKDVMDVLTNKSVEWLKRQSSDKPFFLYFAVVAVHRPITPSDYMRGVSDCGPYGDFIQDVDLSVGRIVEVLKYLNLYDNTIIIFSSDNGGVIPENKPDEEESQAIKYGLKINGNLRGRKHTIWEGGTNVPFIVTWPGKVARGSVSDDLVNLMDIFATVAEITGDGLPDNKDVAPDSFSFLPSLLKKENKNQRKSMVTADSKGMHAIRMGDWKFIDNSPPPGFPEKMLNQYKNETPQLYNLKDDPAEQNNLYDKHPDKVKQLLDELNRIRKASSTR
ncbi:MAG: arylsulfatase [Acidobacteria bacterium]|nr:arylsulfatase [Acidobacteriota bacterium]